MHRHPKLSILAVCAALCCSLPLPDHFASQATILRPIKRTPRQQRQFEQWAKRTFEFIPGAEQDAASRQYFSMRPLWVATKTVRPGKKPLPQGWVRLPQGTIIALMHSEGPQHLPGITNPTLYTTLARAVVVRIKRVTSNTQVQLSIKGKGGVVFTGWLDAGSTSIPPDDLPSDKVRDLVKWKRLMGKFFGFTSTQIPDRIDHALGSL